ncbi:MAG: TonB-dependent receptor [Muribaculaceae bacterium]|nr:TonB-dependent receptor [Muribaculaceae bacterium]
MRKAFYLGFITIVIVLSTYIPANAQSDTTEVQRLHEIVVTGSNQAVGRNLLPYTVSTVDNKQLESTGKTQLLAAVSGIVPSLFISERNIFGFGLSNGGSGGIKIRGVGSAPTNAILMMVDGQPQFAGIYSHHVADFYETEYVERVEVLRGPASVLYGSNAMGGVINVITKDVKENGIHTTLSSQYGSFNTWQSSLSNTTRFGKFSSLVSAGYDRTDGTTKNFDFKQTSVYAKVGYDFSNYWRARADYSFMHYVGNDPIYATLSNPESTDIYHQNVIRGEASLTITDNYASTNGALRIYYSYGNHFIYDPRYFHSLDDRFGILAYQNFTPWRGADATIGFDFDRYTGQIPFSGGKEHTEGSLSTMARKYITEYSPYITFAQKLCNNHIVLNGGLRLANSSMFSSKLIPQVGFVIHPANSWQIKGSIAKGYRNPSFHEMYLYAPANPDLEPENMLNYELALGKSFGRYFSIDLTAYFCKGYDMIQTVDMKNVNTGSFINKGIEVSAKSNPIDNVVIRASYSYLHTTLSNLTGAPSNQYYLGINWKITNKLHADAELKGVGNLYVGGYIENQNYALLNMKFNYRLIKCLDLFINFDNVTNTQYVINRGYDMPGFTVMGGFKLSL